jgi:hypothetical protein
MIWQTSRARAHSYVCNCHACQPILSEVCFNSALSFSNAELNYSLLVFVMHVNLYVYEVLLMCLNTAHTFSNAGMWCLNYSLHSLRIDNAHLCFEINGGMKLESAVPLLERSSLM